MHVNYLQASLIVDVRVNIECVRYFISKYLPLYLSLLVCCGFVSARYKIKIYMYNYNRDKSAGHLQKWNIFATYCFIYFDLF